MSRKMILLNLALIALTATLIWQARKHYLEMKAHEQEVLRRAAHARPVLPPPPPQAPPPVAPAQYIDVAQRTLFSADRNPVVVVEPPKPKPEPPMPALPSYYGQIRIGDPVIFLSIRGPEQKRYHAGEKVGDFEIVSFDQDKITLGWNDKKIEKKLDDLKVKTEAPQQAQSAAVAPPSPASRGAQVKLLGGSGDARAPDKTIGDTISGTEYKACVMNDPTPAGSVVDGYKKVVTRTLMGNSCLWEKVK